MPSLQKALTHILLMNNLNLSIFVINNENWQHENVDEKQAIIALLVTQPGDMVTI